MTKLVKYHSFSLTASSLFRFSLVGAAVMRRLKGRTGSASVLYGTFHLMSFPQIKILTIIAAIMLKKLSSAICLCI